MEEAEQLLASGLAAARPGAHVVLSTARRVWPLVALGDVEDDDLAAVQHDGLGHDRHRWYAAVERHVVNSQHQRIGVGNADDGPVLRNTHDELTAIAVGETDQTFGEVEVTADRLREFGMRVLPAEDARAQLIGGYRHLCASRPGH